ncbi:MAG TPA: hypothetical protein VEJ16_06025 [Alphaproteobacteria bacterium]|nr:hypothetical protein [Alphaproteobacteria bacterium]
MRDGTAMTDAALADVDRFAARVRTISWFAAAGEPLLESERTEVERYLERLGITGMRVAPARDWIDTERIVRDPHWDRRWWHGEEEVRKALLARAAKDHEMGALISALTRVTNEATGTVLGMALIAALRSGTGHQAIAAAAAGAATQACYQAALAIAAGTGETHPFAVKRRLFEAGRWPLAAIEDAFYIL